LRQYLFSPSPSRGRALPPFKLSSSFPPRKLGDGDESGTSSAALVLYRKKELKLGLSGKRDSERLAFSSHLWIQHDARAKGKPEDVMPASRPPSPASCEYWGRPADSLTVMTLRPLFTSTSGFRILLKGSGAPASKHVAMPSSPSCNDNVKDMSPRGKAHSRKEA